MCQPFSWAIILLLASSAAAQAPRKAEGGDGAVAAIAAVNRLFEAMRARDAGAVREAFLPDGRLASTMLRGGQPTIRLLTLDAFVKMVIDSPEPFRERMFEPEARVSGDLATVWGRYEFRVGERLTNCGVNSFQLLRTPQGWKILHAASTIITEGCETYTGAK